MHLHNHIFPSLLNGRGCPLWVGVGLLFLLANCQKIDFEDIEREQKEKQEQTLPVPTPDNVPDDAPDDTDGETREVLLFSNDTAQFYISKREVVYITLESIADPRTEFQRYLSPYRMPTRSEASLLRRYTAPEGYWKSGQRILCYDETTLSEYNTNVIPAYYTFEFGGVSVTQAGKKTKYCVLGIRTEPLPTLPHQDTDFNISVNDQWE